MAINTTNMGCAPSHAPQYHAMTCIPGHQQQVASLSSMLRHSKIGNWRENWWAKMPPLRVMVSTAMVAVLLVLPACGGRAGLRVGLPVASIDRRTDAGQGSLEKPLHLALQLRGGARQGAGNAKGERARANATPTPTTHPQTAAQTGQNATHEHADASGVVNWDDELPDALRGVPEDEWLQKVEELRAVKEVASLSLSARLLWIRVCVHSGCREAQLGAGANRREYAGRNILLTSGQQELKEAFRRTRSKPDAKKLLVAQDAYARAKRYLTRAAGATLRAAEVLSTSFSRGTRPCECVRLALTPHHISPFHVHIIFSQQHGRSSSQTHAFASLTPHASLHTHGSPVHAPFTALRASLLLACAHTSA
jgi:hypothetical protein